MRILLCFVKLTAIAAVGLITSICVAALACALQARLAGLRWATSPSRIGVGPLSPDKQAWSWGVVDGIGFSELLAQVVDDAMVRSYDVVPPPETGLMQPVLTPPPRWSIVSERPTPPAIRMTQNEQFPSLMEHSYGWPSRCMSYHIESFAETRRPNGGGPGIETVEFEPTFDGAAYADVVPAWLAYHDHRWPTRIIWTGLITNVLFFATLSGSPWWIRALMRWRRARNGRCVRCGYSIAGLNSEKCPECGSTAAVRADR